jgi:hypothetical protein
MIFNHSPFNLSMPPFYKPQGRVLDLFWSSATRRIAQTLIIVFSAVYVYQGFSGLGFSYISSIIFVCLFYALFLLSKLMFLSVAENLSIRAGFKGMIWLSVIPFAFFIPTMIYAETRPLFFFIAALFYGAQSAFYWWGYHGYFIKTGDKEHYGGGIGVFEFINTLAVVATPFFGGLLISIYGFSFLYALAGLFMFLSLVLLGKGNDQRQNTDVFFMDVIKLIFKHRFVSSAYVGISMEGAFYFIGWPLFLYFLFGEVVSLGTFVTLSMLVAAILGVFVGNKIDREGERGVVAISTPLLSFSWLLKLVSLNLPLLIVADSIRNLGEKLLAISLTELTYKKASEAESAKAILFREVSTVLGGLICLFFIAALTLLGFDLIKLFFFVAFFALLPLILVFKGRI